MGGKRAIVIQIPVRLQRQFQKVQTRLIRELEKKFSGRTVVFMAWVSAAATASLDVCLESSWSQSVHVLTTFVYVAVAELPLVLPLHLPIYQRRILPKPKRNQRTKQKQLRPRSRTLTSVHDAMLEDLVYPAEIIGKRIRVRLDGSRFIKVHLDKTQQTNIEHKVSGAGSAQMQDQAQSRRHKRHGQSRLVVHVMVNYLYPPTWPLPSRPSPSLSMQLEIFTGIYSKLTGKHVTFEFHASD